MNERRHHYRTDCRISACIEDHGLIAIEQHCLTSNIGMKGVFMPNAPHKPIGTVCTLVIHDSPVQPLKIKARVSHLSEHGVGFTFMDPPIESCLRLKHLVKPHWDGKDFMEGMMLMMRYSKPATELKDVLALTSILSNTSEMFVRMPHTPENCHILN